MEEQLKRLLDDLVKTRFAELKGSHASLHLEIPEGVLNDLVHALLVTQQKDLPLLALVNSVRIKGSIALDVKLTV